MAVLELSKDRDVEYGAAFALALTGDASQAERLAKDLETRFPEDTAVKFNYLPAIRALVALNPPLNQKSEPSKAIELLRIATPYDLGSPRTAVFCVLRRSLPDLCARPGLSGRTPRRRSRRGIPEDSRSPRDRRQRSDRRTGALAARPSARDVGRRRTRRRLPTRTSSPCGKTPIPTSPSSCKPERNTQGCSHGRSRRDSSDYFHASIAFL